MTDLASVDEMKAAFESLPMHLRTVLREACQGLAVSPSHQELWRTIGIISVHFAPALHAAQSERVQLLEGAARAVEAFASKYPTDIFVPPVPGQHGATVDGCSAEAIRRVLPVVAASVRALGTQPAAGQPEATADA